MTLFEGVLSKWTNVLKGWRTRYVVLDPSQGELVYYTSRENMVKDGRRGVVPLKGAQLGIDTEDGSIFTIRSGGRTFHFEARDADERQKWLRNLEDAIHFTTAHNETFSPANTALFHSKLLEADGFLQVLINEVDELEQLSQLPEDNSEQYARIVLSSRRLIEAAKYSIVSLQLAKVQMNSPPEQSTDTNAQASVLSASDNSDGPQELSSGNTDATVQPTVDDANAQETPSAQSLEVQPAAETAQETVPTTSDNVSDEDDFYDADDVLETSVASPLETDSSQPANTTTTDSSITFEQYEAAYEEAPEEDLAPIDGTIISHIISQARLSMDLTKITLPTFILERRSFLEMLADFLAHPDEFVNIAERETPRERFIQVVKWYLSAFHAGRKSPVPKKPYNPILGEIFQCSYDLGSTSSEASLAKSGPVPWTADNDVTFLAEQTSHHPPIASFYAECPAKRIELDGCLYTKSKFLGLSIGVHMVGDAAITLLDHDERYVMTFPSAYGRSILGVPWFEMGGKISIDCEKTGYSASIDFLTKPFINGKKHQITGTLFGPDKKEFCKIDGEWNGVMNAKYTDAKAAEVFFDTKNTAVIKKIVRPIAQQEENESRRMWKDVTYYLKSKQMEKATGAKSFLEQRQRDDAKERAAKSLKWQTKYFAESGELKWTYANKLSTRLQSQS